MLLLRHCVQRTNIQNLKAIHNWCDVFFAYKKLCSKNEYTKSESNSQLKFSRHATYAHCVQRTNIQNLKAIHNRINHYVNFSPISAAWLFQLYK